MNKEFQNGGNIIQNSQTDYSNSINTNNKNNKHKKNKGILLLSLLAFIAIVVIIVVLIVLANKKDEFDGNYTRTIMIYMVGSNLETQSGLGTVDLESIDYNKMDNENINVVLIAGGTEEWDNDYIDPDETSIYELTKNGYKKVKTQNIRNMGSSQVFSDFLNYVYDNYETDKYDLIFWNHGGAIDGSEYDDLSGDNLSLEEMKKGLSNSKFNKDNKLEAIMFRTCLNGTIEVASTFKDYSEYLVASEEVTYGFRLASVLNFVNEIEVTDTGYDVSLKFVESYKNQISKLKKYNKSEYIYSTYSVVDLSKMDALISSLNEFVSDINVSSNYKEISKVRSSLHQYAYTHSGQPDYDMVDLYNLVDGLKHLSPDKGAKVLENLEMAILYNWATNSNSRGMSIYFPYNGKSKNIEYFLDIYSDIDSLDEYNDFISGFYLTQSTSNKTHSFTSNNVNILNNNNVTYDFSLELTEDQLSDYVRAEYFVFLDKGDGYYWPVYRGKDVDLNGNILGASINGNHLKIVDDDVEYVVPLFETYNGDDYIKYNTYVVLQDLSSSSISEWKVESAELSLVLDKNTNEVKVDTVLLDEAGDMPNTIALDLNEYQYISFGSTSRKLLDENGNIDVELYLDSSNGIYEGVEITVDEVNNFKLSSFDDDNSYYATFIIYDVNNNSYYSNLVKMN